MHNPLTTLARLGQSVWYDSLRRAQISSGHLRKMMREDGLRGVTSNPTIFEKAIGGGSEYDASLNRLVRRRLPTERICEALMVEDIAAAADTLAPVHRSTGGRDGFVSIEVSPTLAADTRSSIGAALHLVKALSKGGRPRPNIMVKIPATNEGIPAIEELLAAGVNINITLIFSRDQYMQVASAWLRALERRVSEGLPVRGIASVASVFVSRIDTMVDDMVAEKISMTPADSVRTGQLKALLGKTAIANAKMIYQDFKGIIASDRYIRLAARGAAPQRPLWASTGTKNINYADTMYIDPLIGPDTITTMPPATMDAYRDHGRPAGPTIEKGLDEASVVLDALPLAGINLSLVCQALLAAGVRSFSDSWEMLLESTRARKQALLQKMEQRQTLKLGAPQAAADAAIAKLARQDFVRRFVARDPTLWKPDEASGRIIRNRMGWLSIADKMLDHVEEIGRVADGVRRSGFRHVVLLGMGGSSLCPDVLRQSFAHVKGYPELLVLDSTDPGAVRDVDRAIRPDRALFIVASKSGTTTESQMFFQYFHDRVERSIKRGNPGDHFIAITDPGTPLEELGRVKLFRHVFINQADIGGRYSALSYFGMVPAAFIGLEITKLLDRGERMIQVTRPSLPIADCPAVVLGAALGALAKQGRDKVTFVASAPIASFGYWVEQLIAESTGKEGRGIVPVEGETLGPPTLYGADRVFVHLKLRGKSSAPVERSLGALRRAGHPVITILLEDLYDLGSEFNRWEIATAVTGSLMQINPFDEPNVKESKDNTNRVLDGFRKDGRLPEAKPALRDHGISAFGWMPPGEGKTPASLAELMSALCGAARKGDYIALMAWLPMRPEIARRLARLRQLLRARTRAATTLGFGPRFLHSTGQLHKGGAGNGLFVQITSDHRFDVPIPGEPFSFGVLQAAQAAGDFESLSSRRLRALRLHLGGHVEKDLDKLAAALAAARI